MTLCIAAACRHEGQSAIVTCADWQVSGTWIAWEDYYKLRHYPNATIMISGELGAADELCFDLYDVIKDFNGITKSGDDFEPRVGQYMGKLREAAARRKRLRAEHQIAMNYGISLDQFYKKGSKLMPKEIYKRILEEIQRIGLEVETLIIYSGDADLLILRTGPKGGIFWERNYAAIGSGARVALAVLCQTPHDKTMPLIPCLVRVLEAKIAAERDPYVGRNTSLGIILKDGRRHDISDEGWAYLMDKVARPVAPMIAGDMADIPVLGKLLAEGEGGLGRQTADRWAQG